MLRTYATHTPSSHLGWGLNNEVDFPILTTYFPPIVPDAPIVRYRPPPRPPVKYRNDLALAGPREHAAQTLIAKRWRGLCCRRNLSRERFYADALNYRAIRIQSWWRRLRAIWRRRTLYQLREEWVKETHEFLVRDQITSLNLMLTWQRQRVEGAAVLIQRVFRYYRSHKLKRVGYQFCGEAKGGDGDVAVVAARCGLHGGDAADVENHPSPIPHRRKVYLPWRKRPLVVATTNTAVEAVPVNGSAPPCKQSAKRPAQSTPLPDSRGPKPPAPLATTKRPPAEGGTLHSIFEFKPFKEGPHPPSMEEVETINMKMRAVEAARAFLLSQPPAKDRDEWKAHGLHLSDMDHNAGLIQRVFLTKLATESKHTREITKAYFYKYVWMIQRTFRLYTTIRRMKYRRMTIKDATARRNAKVAEAGIARIKEEAVWDLHLLMCAATTIQRCWRWYRHRAGFGKASGHRPGGPAFAGSRRDPDWIDSGMLAKGDDRVAADESADEPPPPPPFNLLNEHMAAMDAKDPEQRKLKEALRRQRRGVLARFDARSKVPPTAAAAPLEDREGAAAAPVQHDEPQLVEEAEGEMRSTHKVAEDAEWQLLMEQEAADAAGVSEAEMAERQHQRQDALAEHLNPQ